MNNNKWTLCVLNRKYIQLFSLIPHIILSKCINVEQVYSLSNRKKCALRGGGVTK